MPPLVPSHLPHSLRPSFFTNIRYIAPTRTLTHTRTLNPHPQVRLIVKEEVSTRKRMLLVQAVSQFRQRRVNEAVTSLQNLLSCVALMPEDAAMPWKERGELQEVYGLYCAKVGGCRTIAAVFVVVNAVR